jgi:nucleoside-diphosphate-sugar epimerase
MKTILITGCAGLLGTNLSRHLLSKNYRVIGIDNFFGGYSNFLPTHENFTFYELNLESDDLTFIFNENKIDVVFHFAAYAAEGLSPFIRKFNYTNNVIASSNIINHCIINEIKLIFTSSMAVYGNQEVPFTELMRPLPVDPYGIAKYSVEQDIICGSEQFGLKYNIIRPHNVLGIYQNIWDKYRNVIGIFIRRVLNNLFVKFQMGIPPKVVDIGFMDNNTTDKETLEELKISITLWRDYTNDEIETSTDNTSVASSPATSTPSSNTASVQQSKNSFIGPLDNDEVEQ